MTTATSLLARLNAGAVSSEEVVRSCLDRAERLKRLNAFVHLEGESVLAQARSLDARRKQEEPLGPLAGLPVAIKDVLCVEGEPTTCGSRMLASFRPPYNATVISRLRAAGAVLFGKTNMDEFAMGSSTETSFYGPTRNPWDEERIPGGSSGGSAVAVAAGLTPLALGTDTGGSIRFPAAMCGIVGLKPTYGRVSRYGLIAYGSSLDQVGPFAHDVADCALLLQAIAGGDPLDSTSVDRPVPDYLAALDTPPESLRIGVVPEFFAAGLDAEVEAAIREAVRVYAAAGATIKEVSLPHSKYGVPAYYIVAPAECSSNLARYDGTIYGHRAADISPRGPGEADLPPMIRMMMASRAEGFGAEVKRRIMLGTFALSAGYADQYYNQALKVRRLIRNDFDAAFKEVDVLIGPTSPTAAFRIGEKIDDPLAMYLSDIYTITANLAGIPGISIPGGMTKSGLPIGLQLLAPAFEEENLLRTARVFERDGLAHKASGASIMSIGGGGSGSGLLADTTLADLDIAWRERESEAAALTTASFPMMALALRLYSLEIRIKTVICKRLNLDVLPAHCKTHSLSELIIFTGLRAELDNPDPTMVAIRENWDLLKNFSKDRLNSLRYLPGSSLNPSELKQLLDALDDPQKGVLTWLSSHP